MQGRAKLLLVMSTKLICVDMKNVIVTTLLYILQIYIFNLVRLPEFTSTKQCELATSYMINANILMAITYNISPVCHPGG